MPLFQEPNEPKDFPTKVVKHCNLSISLICDPTKVDLVESPLNIEQQIADLLKPLGWEIDSMGLYGPVNKEIIIDP